MQVSDLKLEVDALASEMRAEFGRVRAEFVDVRAEFVNVRAELAQLRTEFVRLMTEEGVRTRRHFDVVGEQMRGNLRDALEQSSAVSAQLAAAVALNAIQHEGFIRLLDNHDIRIASLE